MKSRRLSGAAATSHAACTTAQEIGADAILTVSQRGTTARLVSRFHPGTPIIACLLDQQVRPRVAAGTRGFVFGTRRNVEQQRTVGKAGDLFAGIGVRNAVPPFNRNGSAQIVLAGPLGHLPDRIGVAPSHTEY